MTHKDIRDILGEASNRAPSAPLDLDAVVARGEIERARIRRRHVGLSTSLGAVATVVVVGAIFFGARGAGSHDVEGPAPAIAVTPSQGVSDGWESKVGEQSPYPVSADGSGACVWRPQDVSNSASPSTPTPTPSPSPSPSRSANATASSGACESGTAQP